MTVKIENIGSVKKGSDAKITVEVYYLSQEVSNYSTIELNLATRAGIDTSPQTATAIASVPSASAEDTTQASDVGFHRAKLTFVLDSALTATLTAGEAYAFDVHLSDGSGDDTTTPGFHAFVVHDPAPTV